MKKSVLALFALCLLVLFASAAFAQQGGNRRGQGAGGPGGPGGPGGDTGIGMLVRNADIKAHLGLTEDQVKKLEGIAEEMRPARPEGGRARGEGQPSEADRQQRRAEAEKRQADMQAKVNAVLTPEQQAKYKVLAFQLSEGLESPFLSVRMLEALDLTAEQKEKLRAIQEQRNQAARGGERADFRNMSQEERQRRMQERTEASRKISEQMVALLTAEQKEKAAKLTAEGKELREKIRAQRGEGQRRGRGGEGGDGAYRPGNDSWRPGQGTQGNQGARTARRSFPQAE